MIQYSMDLRVHVQRILFILLFITLFTGIGAADTVFVDNFADSSVPESPFGMLGVLAGFGAVCLLRRK